MSRALRLSEKWFRRGLWLVAVLFAWFLTGLGQTMVRDLPKAERQYTLEEFINQGQAAQLKAVTQNATAAREEAHIAHEQAQLHLNMARADNQAARETYSNWLASRAVTQRSDQDAEVIKRTQQLDLLRQQEREALAHVQKQEQLELDAQQALNRAIAQRAQLDEPAQAQLQIALRAQELRVFLYRLAMTLPLLVIAGWLFKTRRKSSYWPFVWGFIMFALMAFFVELVPYLPSYGGYVRYIVGIVVTVVGGRYAIAALQNYLERMRQIETRPDVQRRQELDYDLAHARLAKSACPGCERSLDLKDGRTDFCPHCGLCVFDHCNQCSTRKSTFSRFCFSCGTASKPQEVQDQQ